MFDNEKQQIGICMLKSNLEEIENNLAEQRMNVPVVDAECEKKKRLKEKVRKVKCEISEELERLNLENMQRVATNAKVKRLRDDIVDANETAAEWRNQFTQQLEQEEEQIDRIIHKFGDGTYEITERFRNTHRYYNEEEINKETAEVNTVLADLKRTAYEKQCNFNRLKALYEAKQPIVHEKFIQHIDQQSVCKIIKSLEGKLENLKQELQALQ